MSGIRAHVFSPQNSITVKESSTNAFTTNAINLCDMLTEGGAEVYHYGSEGSEVACKEHIDCVTIKELDETYGDNHRTQKEQLIGVMDQYAFKMFHNRAVWECLKRVKPGDVLCAIWNGHEEIVKEIASAEPGVITTEPTVGYTGCFSGHRVFPSKSFRDYHYGLFHKQHEKDYPDNMYDSSTWTVLSNPWTFVKEGDDVIPHALDMDQFTLCEDKEDYLLFVGRIIFNKGVDMAVKIAQEVGRKLLIAGQGDFEKELGYKPPEHVELLGRINPEQRDKLMGKAYCGLGYTRHLEPFGYVGAEFNACGTPFNTYPWGGFSEIVQDGITGFHTMSFSEACDAVEKAGDISPLDCRENIEERFTMDVVGPQFIRYFNRITKLAEANNKGIGYYHV